MKTIAYYLQPDTGATLANQALLADETTPVASSSSPGQGWGRGLVRRALDRAATQWAFENNDLSRLDATGEVIAQEVVALEFRYFDGQQWLTEWDSELAAGLPMAIEVAMGIEADDGDARFQNAADNTQDTLSDTSPASNIRVYHQVIRIPSAEPTFDQDALETDVE